MDMDTFLNYINHTLPISLLNNTTEGYKALDVGCGSGSVVELLRNKHLETYGIEVKKYCNDVILGDTSKLCFKQNSLDIITCILVLPHLPIEKEKSALEEFKRILKPNGKLCLVVFNNSILNFKNFFKNINKLQYADKGLFWNNPGDDFEKIRYFNARLHTTSSIKKELNSIGFHVDKIISANYSPPLINKLPHYLKDYIYKLLYENEKYLYHIPIIKNLGKRIIIIASRN